MSKMLMNLTMPIILEEIENVLESEPYYSQYQIAIPDLRQKLLSYTLNHVRRRYRSIDQSEQTVAVLRSNPSSLEEHLQVEAVVRQGIQQLVQRLDLSGRTATQPASSSAEQSCEWFIAC
ncbi:hypothetical protein IFO70_28610 [Phormidium tenue FACHB-886]|nr:hypothetical protein [Phormidium tenue FACHB-886]